MFLRSVAQSPPSITILHNHAQMVLGLKGAEHADYKGVLSKRQDISLNKSLLDLVSQN